MLVNMREPKYSLYYKQRYLPLKCYGHYVTVTSDLTATSKKFIKFCSHEGNKHTNTTILNAKVLHFLLADTKARSKQNVQILYSKCNTIVVCEGENHGQKPCTVACYSDTGVVASDTFRCIDFLRVRRLYVFMFFCESTGLRKN